MSLSLTPQQRKEYSDRRIAEFKVEVDKLLDLKNLVMFAILQYTPQGIIPIISLADKENVQPPNESPEEKGKKIRPL